jgi:hypothetical protein
MKLQQNQIWHKGSEYYRIVQLGRLEVQYKTMTDPLSGRGPHEQVTKKEFCRLLKGAVLVEAEALSGQLQEQQQQ